VPEQPIKKTPVIKLSVTEAAAKAADEEAAEAAEAADGDYHLNYRC
jgi:hypothetical protein